MTASSIQPKVKMNGGDSMNGNGTPLQQVNKIVFEEPSSREDIRETARIATEVFAETSVCLFPDGPNEEQLNYRTNKFDQLFIASLAYKQGIRSRPAKFLVAKDAKTKKVIAFCSAIVEGGSKEEEESFIETDNLPCQSYSPFPKFPDPKRIANEVWKDFQKICNETLKKSVGNRKICHIRYLAVDPKIQRSGAGRSLLHLFRKQFHQLPLYLEAEITPSAKQFYEKMGFKQVGLVDFKGCIKPLPCMLLEPDTQSLLDQIPITTTNATTNIENTTPINGHLLDATNQIPHSATPTPPTLSA